MKFWLGTRRHGSPADAGTSTLPRCGHIMVRSRRTKVAPEDKLRICCAPTAVGCCCPRFAQHPDQRPLRRQRCNRTVLGRSRSAGSLARLGNPRSTAFATQRIPNGDLLRRRRGRLIRAERRTVVRGCIEEAHDYPNHFWDSPERGVFRNRQLPGTGSSLKTAQSQKVGAELG